MFSRGLTWLALLVATGAIGPSLRADPAADDLQKLQGRWTVVSGEAGGQAREELKKVRISIEGDVIAVQSGDKLNRGKVKLDPAQKPAHLTIQPDDRDEPLLGIYALDKDGLRLCMGDVGAKVRPTKFATAEGSRHVLLMLAREKP